MRDAELIGPVCETSDLFLDSTAGFSEPEPLVRVSLYAHQVLSPDDDASLAAAAAVGFLPPIVRPQSNQ